MPPAFRYPTRLPCVERDPGTGSASLSALTVPRRLITLGCSSMTPVPRQTVRGFNSLHPADITLVADLRIPSMSEFGSEPLLFALEGRHSA